MVLHKALRSYISQECTDKGQLTYVISLHVSFNCSSVCKVPVSKLKVETCSVSPIIARCLET